MRRLISFIAVMTMLMGIMAIAVNPLSADDHRNLTKQERVQAVRDRDLIAHDDNLSPIALSRAEKRAAQVTPCIQEGDGDFYRVLYIYPEGTASRYASVVGNLRTYVGAASDFIDASAQQTGGRLQLRVLHDSNCDIVVEEVAVPLSLMRDFWGLYDWAAQTGRTNIFNPSVNALMYLDDNYFCGVGSIWNDDTDRFENMNNDGGEISVVGLGCWGANVTMHEVGHNAGAVQQTAPNRTPGWHCTDEYDIMCYNDGTGTTTVVCPDPSLDNLYDCNDNDYFNTNPPAGSYLDTHWNPAQQPWRFFLVPGSDPDPTPDPTETPEPTPDPTETPTPDPTVTPDPDPTVTPDPDPTVTPEPTPEPGEPTLDTGREKVKAGQKLKVTATNFEAGTTVRFLWHGNDVIGSATVNEDGTATDMVRIPKDANEGQHRIVATNGDETADANIRVFDKGKSRRKG